MIRAIGFAQGQLGDLIIQTVACRAFKEQYPGSHLTFGIAEKYRDAMPLFINHPYIDDFHIWDGYDNWPSSIDKEYLEFKKFDMVFNAMPPHTRQDWYNYHTYAEENCLRFGLKVPNSRNYWLRYENCMGRKKETKQVTLSLFPSNNQLSKTIPVEEAEKLCIGLKQMDYIPIQLGGKFEYIKLKNAIAPHFSIYEATKTMVNSSFHITADTAFSSIAAAYGHRTLGFYGLNYPDMKDCFSHLPPNPEAVYIKNKNPQTITAEELLTKVKENFI